MKEISSGLYSAGDAVIPVMPHRDAMNEGDPDDEVIRERSFRISDRVEIEGIIQGIGEAKEEGVGSDKGELDEALGEIFDPFSEPDSESPGFVSRDGSVKTAPGRDVVTEMAVEGERRVNWLLMGSMILVYSAIGIQIGVVMEPLPAGVSLVVLAALGFGLGEIWIPRKNMKILGVTWVIISMKVLYGLAIELQRWDVIGVEELGALLVALVGINVAVAYRYDHDAIAAQSTLVLLAIGSTAGSLFGQGGIALMILFSTMLIHGLALQRMSGNLAALGIAASNLWIGMHATTSGFQIGELRILPLDSPLLLFTLMMAVTAANASMASRYARESNWFSDAMKVMGLGKPGLWGVSVSMGLIGALLAVAANREDTGYALAMVTVLGGAFGGSYLTVRGVASKRVMVPLGASALVLIAMLSNGDLVEEYLAISEYVVFTIVGAAITGFVVLRDQDIVTDRVLWGGAVAILILLVILVPSESAENGGDGGVLLLSLLSLLHLGTAILSVRRESPSLAGVTVLLPWVWILMEETLEEAIRTVLVANDRIDPGSVIELDVVPLAGYLILCSILMSVVNERLGSTNVNLASRFLGISEISASIRDSGTLQLWSLGLWIPMITTIFMAQFGGFTSFTLVLVCGAIWILHLAAHVRKVRVGNVSMMLGIIFASAVIIQWRHGEGEILSVILCFLLLTLIHFERDIENRNYTLAMGMMSLPFLIFLSGNDPSNLLAPSEYIPELDTGLVVVLCTAAMLGSYLPKAGAIEDLLRPALASLWLMVISISLTWQIGEEESKYASIVIFVISSLWLVARGEIRRELQTMSLLSERREMAAEDSRVSTSTSTGDGNVSGFNPRVAELREARRKRRELSPTEDLGELYVTDVSHKPVIVISVMAVVLGASVLIGLTTGSNPVILLSCGAFVTVLVAVARFRTRGLELPLPHIGGMETPIALAIVGIVVAHVASLIGPGSSNQDLLGMAVVVVIVVELVAISLFQQENMLDRIPIAIDWLIISLFVDRLIGSLLYESLPWPLTVDPLTGDLLEWKLPLLLLEAVLVIAVIADFWIDNLRTSRGRVESKGGSGRGGRAIAVVMLSFGLAGAMAICSAIIQGLKREQQNSVGLAIPGVILVMLAVRNWIDSVSSIITEASVTLGAIAILLCVLTVPTKKGDWALMLAANGHLLIVIGLLGGGAAGLLPIALIVMSTSVWVIGILQLRRGLRIWGLVDLVLAILTALVFFGSALTNPGVMLAGLTIVAMELGIVSWLGITYEKELVRD
ncbi:MAG: hypothetical protein CMB22_03420 [Euryarchaeota archaeon]|nr:hypothetical protein [Euryarchaeota archaeon]